MMNKIQTLLFLTLVFSSSFVFSQQEEELREKPKSKSAKTKFPAYFGFQVKPIFPAKWIGTKTVSYDVGNFHTDVTQITGYSLGGVVRVNLSKIIALETGINTTQRRYNIKSSVADSNLYADQTIRFVTYDIPLSALFYIRLSEQFYMNASIGGAFVFNPTLARVRYNEPNTNHSFIHTALAKKAQFDVLANIGFEFRTKKAGIFYIGGVVRVPVKPLFYMSSTYEYEGFVLKNDALKQGRLDGAYMALEVKYFFPIGMKSKGPVFEKGPIE